MKLLLLFLLAASVLLAAACRESDDDGPRVYPPPDTTWTFDTFLAAAETLAFEQRQALVDSFLAHWGGIVIPPVYVEPDSVFGTAVFLLTHAAPSANVAGDFNAWSPTAGTMIRLTGTSLFYRTYRFERNARFDYKFVLGSNWILDPRNPRVMAGGFGSNSQMWMPDFTPPVEAANDPNIPHGAAQTFSIHSAILNNTRIVTVYLPANYDSAGSYPVLYAHDGPDYRNFLRIHNIADYLIAHNHVPPFIVATVPWASPPGREGEYHMNPNFARFFTEELIPYVDAHFATLAAPGGRAIVGESSAGLGAVYLAWTKPEYFRWAIGQSGYYSFNGDAMIDSIAAADPRDVRFYLEVGTYETNLGGGVNLVTAQERLADVLAQKGYAYEERYVPDGHSWGNWQRTLPDAIRWMW